MIPDNPVIIDLSNGWNDNEISKLILALPCSEEDKVKMEMQNKVITDLTQR